MEDHTEMLIGIMQKTIEQKDEQIKELRQTIADLQATVANLNETLEEFRRKFFGSSSEKTRRKTSKEEESEQEGENVTVKSHTRKKKPKSKREDLYKNLPVREVKCPVPEDRRLCPDCDARMETIAWTPVREELCITPAKVERVRYLQEVLVCPVCRKEDEGTFTKAPTPHTVAGPQSCLPLHGRICHVPEIHEFGPVLPSGDGLAAEGGSPCKGNSGKLVHQMCAGIFPAGL